MDQHSRRRISDRRHNRSAAGSAGDFRLGSRVIPTGAPNTSGLPQKKRLSDAFVMLSKCRLRFVAHVANRSQYAKSLREEACK